MDKSTRKGNSDMELFALHLTMDGTNFYFTQRSFSLLFVENIFLPLAALIMFIKLFLYQGLLSASYLT